MSHDTTIPKRVSFHAVFHAFRDWSLIMGRGGGGGLQNGRGGGHMKFYPYEKKGGGGTRSDLK